MNSRRFLFAVLTFTAVVISRITWAAPPEGVLDTAHANVRAVMALQGKVTPGFMKLEGILGTAVGLGNQDEPLLVVYVDRDAGSVADLVRSFPPQIGGIGVKVEVTDKFIAFAGKPPGAGGGGGGGTTVSHTAKQPLPIKLGTSGGWRNDIANGYCCGGTLGSLIRVSGSTTLGNDGDYILSNYHVFEADINPGSDAIVATTGDPIIQPGLIDVGCNANNAQNVATLVKLSSLPNNNVDCAVARVNDDMVSDEILQIGKLSAQTVTASLNQAVKKSGRTTALTRSKVSGLNATISVAYQNECAGGAAFTRTFTGQIVVANRGSKFLAGGDSGSLMVQDVTANPKAVGLLYAGSSTSAIANPIGEVLTFVGRALGGSAAMVGNN